MAVTGRQTKPTGRGHYVMDLYFPDPGARDGFRREVLRIEAADDAAAIAECARIDSWRGTSHYRIRAIRNSVRSGDAVIFDSEAAAASSAEAPVIVLEAEPASPSPSPDEPAQPEAS